jgi:aspartate racemase
VILQTPDELLEAMSLVERIKGGDKSDTVRDGLRVLAEQLVNRGAKVLIAACTEFPLVLDESLFDVAFISSTDVLAQKTVAMALGTDT